MHLKISLKSIEALLLIFIVIFNSGYMLQVCNGNFAEIIPKITIIVGIIFFFFFLLKNRKKVLIDEQKKFISLFSFFSILSTIVNPSSFFSLITLLSTIFIAYAIVEKYNIQKIIKAFNNTMAIISIVSLIFLLFINIYGIPNSFSMVDTPVGNSVYNYYVFFYPKLWNYSFVRNTGIFWEPGLFSSYLIFALILEISFCNHFSKKRTIIFLVTLISTLSTAGIMMIPLIFIIFINEHIKNNKYQIIYILFLFLLFLLLLFQINSILEYLATINPQIFSKLVDDSVSLNTRLNGPLLNLKIFINNPIFGFGYTGANNSYISLMSSYGIDAQTSTSTYFLAAIGFFGFLYTYEWVKSILKLKNKNWITKTIIIILILFILNKEPHTYLLGTWLLLFIFSKYDDNLNGPTIERKV